MDRLLRARGLGLCILFMGYVPAAIGAAASVSVTPEWNKIVVVSKTAVSISVAFEPPLRRGGAIHDELLKAVQELGVDYTKLQPWFPYSKMAIAELRPPRDGKTYWDFVTMDQMVEDLMQATAGRPVIFNPGAIPRWMFTTNTPVRYPDDPDAIDWSYITDRKLNSSTVKQFSVAIAS